MSANQSKSSEKVAAEVIILESIREWRRKFDENPLDPEVITQGLITLSEIGESALVQAVKYGHKVDEVHDSQHKVHEQLGMVRDKLDTAISRFEGSSKVYENESSSVALELKGLHRGMQEVKDMSQALLDHFNIKISIKKPE